MKSKELDKISRFLSLILRHNPGIINLMVDINGFIKIKLLLTHLKLYGGVDITIDDLKDIVKNNDKQRFFISEDGLKIRASQGHSLPNIDLGLVPIKPPSVLYHGTCVSSVKSIKEQGIIKGNRQYVHLSDNIETAIAVGKRHGEPKVLIIDSKKMFKDGYDFFLTENQVWNIDFVPNQYILKDVYQQPKYNTDLDDVIIFDIDGTLAHHNHVRSPFEWDKVDIDVVDTIVADQARFHKQLGHIVFVVSGRDDSCKDITEKWLQVNNIPYDKIFMRKNKDNRQDTVVKEEIYMTEIKDKYNVRVVYDDRNSVVKMWRDLGLKVLQVQEGNF